MRKIFISYHHLREQEEKDQLAELIKKYANYLNIKDMSVEIGDIDTTWSNNEIAKTIRQNHLKDTTITILILGIHTKCRQHIDWEIEASLNKYGSLNRRKKINSFIILLTADFIKKAKINCNFNNTCDYSSLITQENAGQRIYETVINKHAIIATYDEIFSDIIILKNLLDKVQSNHKKEEMFYQNVISPSFLKPTVLKDNTKDTVFNEKKEIDNAILSSNKDNGVNKENDDNDSVVPSKSEEKINDAILTLSKDNDFNKDDDSNIVVPFKLEEKIDNVILTSIQDSEINNQLLQETTTNFTKDDNKSNLLRKLSLKHNSKDSGIGSELQKISIMKDENFKRIHLHKKGNSEECEAKEKEEKTMQEFTKKTKKFINSGKTNYTQECPEIYLSYL
ncbi:TIR domain-containing protein [Spiroplasma endosymbiont of Panzeria rudis]|uniref:TIR domain-containing protein n=1 Tax=Spiroplasma endosymbiont of Panzeria rudis TaxID=3066301 RepID=UPI0030CDAFAB